MDSADMGSFKTLPFTEQASLKYSIAMSAAQKGDIASQAEAFIASKRGMYPGNLAIRQAQSLQGGHLVAQERGNKCFY